MRVFFLFFFLLSLGNSLRAQEMLPNKFYQEKSHDVYFGFNWLGGDENKFPGSTYRLVEIGYSSSFISYGGLHGPASAMYHISQEFSLNRDFITGTKIGVNLQGMLASFGLSAVIYTNFEEVNVKIRPEFGIGTSRFRLVFGYNIPTFGNTRLSALENAEYAISLNYAYPIFRKITKLDDPKF